MLIGVYLGLRGGHGGSGLVWDLQKYEMLAQNYSSLVGWKITSGVVKKS